MVTIAVTLTTESRFSPVTTEGRKTLPGMVASAVFEVMTAATTVASRLALYGRGGSGGEAALAGPVLKA